MDQLIYKPTRACVAGGHLRPLLVNNDFMLILCFALQAFRQELSPEAMMVVQKRVSLNDRAQSDEMMCNKLTLLRFLALFPNISLQLNLCDELNKDYKR